MIQLTSIRPKVEGGVWVWDIRPLIG
jgi:hypothetical protein